MEYERPTGDKTNDRPYSILNFYLGNSVTLFPPLWTLKMLAEFMPELNLNGNVRKTSKIGMRIFVSIVS